MTPVAGPHHHGQFLAYGRPTRRDKHHATGVYGLFDALFVRRLLLYMGYMEACSQQQTKTPNLGSHPATGSEATVGKG